MTETTVDFNAALVEAQVISPEAYQAVKESAFAGPEETHRFLAAVGELERQMESGGGSPATALKLGMCLLLVGRNEEALKRLHQGTHNGARSFYTALALMELGRYSDAREQLGKAAEQGWDRAECERYQCELDLAANDLEAARRRVGGMNERSADAAYLKGRLALADGDIDGAMQRYDEALAVAAEHPAALFHKAYLLDLYGDDEEAVRIYEQCAKFPLKHSNALVNLAVLYEDRCDFDRAAACLRKVLTANPTHVRARLYLKDVEAAAEMFIDEKQLMDTERRNAVLDIPVTDFELSVRSRNCLKKMNIHTLGDLLRTTEAELLAYKNFGETSLREIKAMLYQKNLSLGQLAEMREATSEGPSAAPAAATTDGQQPEHAEMSVNELELSVRARKCLQRLGIETVGDLMNKSENELLNSKNFGQTSLMEVKQRLSELGISLRKPVA